MSRCIGFTCIACGSFIKIGEKNSDDRGIRLRYVAPLFPLMCDCGKLHRYRNEDLVDELGASLSTRARTAV